MSRRSQPGRLKWPLDPRQLELIDTMFQELYDDTDNGSIRVTTNQLSGVWPVTKGGTGISLYAVGDLLYASATTTLSRLADVATGRVLRSGGVGVAPAWGQVTLTTDVTGILPVANGGTGFSGYTIGDLLYADTASSLAKLIDVTAGSYLRSGGAATAPVWSTLTLPNAASQGDIFIATAANAMTVLAKNVTATRYLSNTGTSNNPAWAQVALATGVSGTLPVANGGTNFATYAVGDLLYADTTTTLAKLADVATGNAVISGGVGVIPAWGKIGLTTHVTGTLGAGNGGTGIASYAVGDIIYASAATTFTALADVAVGSYLRSGGVTTAPVWSTLKLPNASTQGDIFFADAANAMVVLAKNTSATRYLSNTGTSNNPAWAQVDLATGVTGTLPIANGGTAVTSLTPAAYTTTLTDITIGNGTTSSTQLQVGKLVFWSVLITFGTTTTLGAIPRFTVPTSAVDTNVLPMGLHGYAVDASTGCSYMLDFVAGGAATTLLIVLHGSADAQSANTPITSTLPFTWATGDTIRVGGVYFAA